MDNNSRLFFALKNARHVKKGRLIQPAVKKGKSMHQKETKGISMDIKTNGTFENHIFHITSLALTISMFQGLVFPFKFIMMFHKKKPCNIQRRLFRINHSATKPYNFAIQFWLIRSIQQITQISSIHLFFPYHLPHWKTTMFKSCTWMKYIKTSYVIIFNPHPKHWNSCGFPLQNFPRVREGNHHQRNLVATSLTGSGRQTLDTREKKILSHPGWLINPFLLQL